MTNRVIALIALSSQGAVEALAQMPLDELIKVIGQAIIALAAIIAMFRKPRKPQ